MTVAMRLAIDRDMLVRTFADGLCVTFARATWRNM